MFEIKITLTENDCEMEIIDYAHNRSLSITEDEMKLMGFETAPGIARFAAQKLRDTFRSTPKPSKNS